MYAATIDEQYFAAARLNMTRSQGQAAAAARPSLLRALGEVPREHYVLPAQRSVAYAECRLPLSGGRFLASPYELARLYNAADLDLGQQVAVIAGGTGYGASLAAHSVGGGGSVTLFEPDASAANAAKVVTQHYPNISVVHAPDILSTAEVLAGHPPFDRIIIENALTAVPHLPAGCLSAEEGSALLLVLRANEHAPGELVRINADCNGTFAQKVIDNLNLPLLEL